MIWKRHDKFNLFLGWTWEEFSRLRILSIHFELSRFEEKKGKADILAREITIFGLMGRWRIDYL